MPAVPHCLRIETGLQNICRASRAHRLCNQRISCSRAHRQSRPRSCRPDTTRRKSYAVQRSRCASATGSGCFPLRRKPHEQSARPQAGSKDYGPLLHRSPKNTSAAGKGLLDLGQKPACGGRLYGQCAGQGVSSWKSRCSQSRLSAGGAGGIFCCGACQQRVQTRLRYLLQINCNKTGLHVNCRNEFPAPAMKSHLPVGK